MTNRYFIIGGSHLQLSFIKVVKAEGFETFVFDIDQNCPGKKEADHFFNISINEKEKILKIGKDLRPIAVHTVATEQGNLTACYVSEKLNLFSNSYETALNTTDKLRMKKICKENNISTPNYKNVRDIETLKKLELTFPVIVKPTDRSAGRGVALARNQNELLSRSTDAMNYSIHGNILIEEYVDADQFSLETISFNGKHRLLSVCKMTFDGPPNFVEYCHHLPANINSKLLHKMAKFADHVLNSFSIRCGASHIEVRLNEDNEVVLIEAASRMGGWRDWMIKSSLNYDYCKAIMYSSLGEEYLSVLSENNKVAIAKTIISNDDYDEYYKLKNQYPEMIVKDLVLGNKFNGMANNLIECDGPYVICVTKDKAHNILK